MIEIGRESYPNFVSGGHIEPFRGIGPCFDNGPDLCHIGMVFRGISNGIYDLLGFHSNNTLGAEIDVCLLCGRKLSGFKVIERLGRIKPFTIGLHGLDNVGSAHDLFPKIETDNIGKDHKQDNGHFGFLLNVPAYLLGPPVLPTYSFFPCHEAAIEHARFGPDHNGRKPLICIAPCGRGLVKLTCAGIFDKQIFRAVKLTKERRSRGLGHSAKTFIINNNVGE